MRNILLIALLFSPAVKAEDVKVVENEKAPFIPVITGVSNTEEDRDSESYTSIGIFVTGNKVNTNRFQPYGKFEAFYIDTGTNLYENDFTGLSGSMGIAFNNLFSPYIGGGLLMGENNACRNIDGECTDDVVFGAYPEIGLMLYKKEFVVTQVFMRKYLLTDEIKSFSAVGISVGISIF